MGLALLVIVGSLVVAAALIAAVVRDARHPARATAGWALARSLPLDPAAMNLAFTEWLGPEGMPVWEISGGDPEGPVTILLHGWRRSRIDSLRRIRPWIDCSRSLLLVDLPGHGESPANASTLGITDGALVRRLIEDRSESDRGPILLVGHSMGAVVALDVARGLRPEALAGVVAFAPYASLAEPLANRLRARALPAVPVASLATGWFRLALGAESPVQATLEMLVRTGVPTLIAAATNDRTISLCHLTDLCARASVPLSASPSATHDDLGTSLTGLPCADDSIDPVIDSATTAFVAAMRARLALLRTQALAGATVRA